jgi:hypothetical protein
LHEGCYSEKKKGSKKKDAKSTVGISLLDVMYGVVHTYGFGLFDQANAYEWPYFSLFISSGIAVRSKKVINRV